MPEERLASLYDSDGFGGEKTMRAQVIRELIDENQAATTRACPGPGAGAGGVPPRSLTALRWIPQGPSKAQVLDASVASNVPSSSPC